MYKKNFGPGLVKVNFISHDENNSGENEKKENKTGFALSLLAFYTINAQSYKPLACGGVEKNIGKF